jgi:hypothetical protein
VVGDHTLTISGFYFEAGLLQVQGGSIEIGNSGEFNLDWSTVTSEVTISGVTGISLYIENVNISYSDTLEVSIIGSFEVQAGGYITFGPSLFEAGFTGTLDLGTSCEFIINGDSVNVGGLFTLTTGSGEISFSWSNIQFVLDVSGGPGLTVSNLYFEAEIQDKTLLLNADEIEMGANGDMTLSWDSSTDEITISSEAGVYLLLSNIDVTYGSEIDIGIIGTLSIQADGYITLASGYFEASCSGSLTLSQGFGFEINGESIALSGDFDLSGGNGIITITWADDTISCEVAGGVSLILSDLYFQLDNLKTYADFAYVDINGDFTLYLNKNIKKFEISGSLTFGFDNLYLYTKENSQWYMVCSAQNLDISGGGYVCLESGTDANIKLDFNSMIILNNLDVTPPSGWYCGLSIGSTTITGNAYLILEKATSGEGKYSIIELSGIASGVISSFDGYVRLGQKDLEVSFTSFDFTGSYTVIIDDANNDFQVSAEGNVDLFDFDAAYGDVDVLIDMHLEGNGDIAVQYSSDNLDIFADVDYVWDIYLESNLIGDWEAHGYLDGNVDINSVLMPGSGNVEITIHEPGTFHSLEITHDNLCFSLSEISLSPGDVLFDWQKNDGTHTGYITIESDFTQSICTMNLIEIAWGTKSASIGWPEITSGDIKFSWDISNRHITINNGISNLGPTLSYADSSQNLEISGSIGSLQSDYYKTITINWFELGGEISGIQLDTANSYLAQLLQFSVKKSGTGKRLTIYGLQCNDFYIKKGTSGNLELGGQVYIANHLTYSKLISGNWKDFDIHWDLQSTEKWIRFTKDPTYDFTLELLSVDLLGFEFTATVNFLTPDYFEIKWNIGVSGKISIDTNWVYFSSINFVMWHNSGIGLDITASTLRADNWWASWTAWPPSEWNVQTGGSIQFGTINIDVYYNGQWKHLWPW